jgi:hypothetical protein
MLCAVQTQWRAGTGGFFGLDYNVLFRKMDRLNLTPEQYDDMESDVRAMEAAALAAMNEKD